MVYTKEVRSLLVSFLLIVLFSLPGYCATYYIKNAGNDSASGLTDVEAWKTIKKVNSFAFSDGDTVCFKRGDRFDDVTLYNPGVDNFTVKDFGTGSKPHIDGDRVQPIQFTLMDKMTRNLTIENIDISGQDWMQEKGLNMEFRNVSGVTIDGVIGDGHYNGNTSDGKTAMAFYLGCKGPIVVKNCNLYNWGASDLPVEARDYMGIALIDINEGGYEISNNTVFNINSDCLHLYHCVATGSVHHNTFYNAGEDGIDVKGTENCEIFENEFYRMPDFKGEGGTGSGGLWTCIVVHAADGKITKNTVIRNNRLHNGDMVGVKIGWSEDTEVSNNKFEDLAGAVFIGNPATNVYVHHNIIVNPRTQLGYETMDAGGIYLNNSVSGTKILNNTFYNDFGTCKHLVSIASGNGAEIENNIAYHNSSDQFALSLYHFSGAPSIQYNCWYNKSSNNRVSYLSTLYPATALTEWKMDHPGEFFGDPIFVDAKQGNFALSADSPCRIDGRILGAVQETPLPLPLPPTNLIIAGQQ